MRMKIQESAIDGFYLIQELSQTKNICLGNAINIQADILEIIASFQTLAKRRPKVRKLGIYSQITLNNLYNPISFSSCQQMVRAYIRGIKWDDLQYMSFYEIGYNHLSIHIIFNRVTLNGQLIDLNCLGASWQQYEVLRKAYCSVIKPSYINYFSTKYYVR